MAKNKQGLSNQDFMVLVREGKISLDGKCLTVDALGALPIADLMRARAAAESLLSGSAEKGERREITPRTCYVFLSDGEGVALAWSGPYNKRVDRENALAAAELRAELLGSVVLVAVESPASEDSPSSVSFEGLSAAELFATLGVKVA